MSSDEILCITEHDARPIKIVQCMNNWHNYHPVTKFHHCLLLTSSDEILCNSRPTLAFYRVTTEDGILPIEINCS